MKRHRSLGMWLISKLMPLFRFKAMQSRDEALRLLSDGTTPELPEGWKMEHGIPVYTIGEQYGDGIFYIHGGAFVVQLDKSHIDFCTRLSQCRKVRVTIPVYPLLPKHTFKETYNVLTDIYSQLPSGTIIMGDSAGAGIAVGLAMHLEQIGIPGPKRLVLFSPWIDLTMSRLEKDHDCMCRKEALEVFAAAWAAGADLKDWRLSPVYGNLSSLPNTVIYSGTEEMLYEDASKFHERLLDAGIDSKFRPGYGMPHDFVLFPTSERDDVIRELEL